MSSLLVSREEDRYFKSTVCFPPHHSGRILSIPETRMVTGDGWVLVARLNSLLVWSVGFEGGVYQCLPPLARCLPVLVERPLCSKRNAIFPTTSHLTEAYLGSWGHPWTSYSTHSSRGGMLASMGGLNLRSYDRVHYMEVEPPPPRPSSLTSI